MLTKLRHMINGEKFYKAYMEEKRQNAILIENIEKLSSVKSIGELNDEFKINEYFAIDKDLFVTNEYLLKFQKYESDNNCSEEQLLQIFNKLINYEKLYVKGLQSSIFYCKNLKTKNKAMYKQIHEYFFTESGRNEIKLTD